MANAATGQGQEQRPAPEMAYDRWCASQAIPEVRQASGVADLNAAPLGWWEARGGRGCFLHLSEDDQLAAYVLELAPGASAKPWRHLYEETVYVLSGRGATSVWYDEERKSTFEWRAGSLFSLPINAWYQHFNGAGDQPARLFAVNYAPLVMNFFHNLDFVFQNDFRFTDRFDAGSDHFSGLGRSAPGRIWETNFVDDVPGFPLQEWRERGAGGTNVMLELGNATMTAHISEFPVGTYKKAHRHGGSAHIVIVSGEGYSLLFKDGAEPIKADWRPGCLILPRADWFHQHFNTGPEPARYLAIRQASRRFPLRRGQFRGEKRLAEISVRDGGWQIEYADQAAWVHELFVAECARRGVQVRMDAFLRGA